MRRYFFSSLGWLTLGIIASAQGVSPIPRIDPLAVKADKTTLDPGAITEMIRMGPSERRMTGLAIALSSEVWYPEISSAIMDFLESKPELSDEEFALIGQALCRDLGPVKGKADPRKGAFFLSAVESSKATRRQIATEILSKSWDPATYVFIGFKELDYQALLEPKELEAFLSKEVGRRFNYFATEIETVKPSLSKAIQSTDPKVQKSAVEAVGNIAQVIASSVLPPDVSGQRTPAEERTRVILIQPAVEQLSALVELVVPVLNSTDPELKSAAVVALSKTARGFGQAEKPRRELGTKIKPNPLLKPLTDAVPHLTQLLKSEELNTRLSVAEVFENIAESVPLASSLSISAADSSPFVRWTTARALHRNFLVQDAKEKSLATETVNKLLEDRDIDVRNAAIRAAVIYGGGEGGEVLYPKLLKIARTGDRESRAVALESLSF